MKNAAIRRRDLPGISQQLEPAVREPLTRLVEEVRQLIGTQGDGEGRAVTVAEVRRGTVDGGLGTPLPIGGTTPPDFTPPPTVTGLGAVAGISQVIITWDTPLYPQGHGHGQTNLYAVKKVPSDPAEPTFSDAVRVADAPGARTIIALPSEPNTRWHIWAKWQTLDGVESNLPAGGIHGASVTTGQDIRQLLEVLSAAALNPAAPYSQIALRADQFYVASATAGVGDIIPFIIQTVDTEVNGVTIPKGVYMDAAFIVNLQAMVARLGAAWIDDAMIGNLSAAKLTVGDGAIGGDLRSTNYAGNAAGWIVQPNGYAEFNNIVARGTIVAGAGAIGAMRIDATGMESANYTPGPIGAGFRIQGDGNAIFPAASIRGKVTAAQVDVLGTANLADAVIKTAKIDDAAITTLKVAGHAITAPGGGRLLADVPITEGSYITLITVTIDPDGAPVWVTGCVAVKISIGSINQHLLVGLATDSGSDLSVSPVTLWGSDSLEYITVPVTFYDESTTPGPRTYQLRAVCTHVGEATALENGTTLFAIGAKR